VIDENKDFFPVKTLQFTNVPFGTYTVEASHRFFYELIGRPRQEGSDAFSVKKTFVVKDSKRHVIKVELDRWEGFVCKCQRFKIDIYVSNWRENTELVCIDKKRRN